MYDEKQREIKLNRELERITTKNTVASKQLYDRNLRRFKTKGGGAGKTLNCENLKIHISFFLLLYKYDKSMALSKTEGFNHREVELSGMAKAFSHPARIMIIEILSKHKDRTCKELVNEIPLSQATISQHLNELLLAKLICRKKDGAKSLYCVEWNKLERMFGLYYRLSEKTMVNRPKRNCC